MNTHKKMINRTAVALVALWAGLLCTQAVACPPPSCPDCTSGTWPNCVWNCSGGQLCCNKSCCTNACCDGITCYNNNTTQCCGYGFGKTCPGEHLCCGQECCVGTDWTTAACCDGKSCYTVEGEECCGSGDGTTCPLDSCCGGECCDTVCCDGTECCPTSEYCCDGGECVLPDDWSDATISGTYTVPPNIKQKVQDVINKIPNVNITLDEVVASYTQKGRDCCNDGSLITDGERYKEASVTLSAELAGITIWGPPTISETFDFHIAVVQIDLEVGVTLSSDFSVGAKGGKRWNDCEEEECLYGGVTADVSLTLSAKFEMIVCTETLWTTKKCVGVEATPASVSVAIEGEFGYNTSSCGEGISGNICLKDITFSANLSVSGHGAVFSHPIFEGDCDFEGDYD